ncbi:cation transporter, partial [Vibrio vulnificus]|uniref:cation transporter n=1 Tax=Vibrio vulnificus TaxID=672 RepID=UPI001F4D9B83
MLALMVPTVNVMSVWALTAERGISLRALLLPILKNPLILACLAGALVNLAGVGLPGGSDRLLNLLAVHYSLRPADDDHRYGHGKAEALAGLAQAMFIGASAVLVAIQAVEQLRDPQ